MSAISQYDMNWFSLVNSISSYFMLLLQFYSFHRVGCICESDIPFYFSFSYTHRHTTSLATYVRKALLAMRHENGNRVCTVYGASSSEVLFIYIVLLFLNICWVFLSILPSFYVQLFYSVDLTLFISPIEL